MGHIPHHKISALAGSQLASHLGPWACAVVVAAVHLPVAVALRRLAAIGSADEEARLKAAGTYGGHQGEKPDRRARAVAEARGYEQIQRERARRVLAQDFERFDLILAMDRDNLMNLQLQCPPEHQHKIHLFLEFAGVP